MYAHVIPARRHVIEEALDRNFHLVIVAEAPSGQMFFELRKQVVVTGCQVWTIGCVGDDIPYQTDSGEQRFDGRRGGERCRGEGIRPWSAFL